jgi:hypothetical protein
MHRNGSRPIAFAGVAIAAAILASCSGGHGSSSPTTTPSTTASSSTTGRSTVPRSTVPRSTAPPSTRPAGVPAHATTTSVSTSSTPPPPTTAGPTTKVRITGFRILPSSPVSCNAPSMVELQWTSIGATRVTLSIDQRAFATYGSGPQDHLEYFACDGGPHTYTLLAVGGGSTATVSKTVTSR